MNTEKTVWICMNERMDVEKNEQTFKAFDILAIGRK